METFNIIYVSWYLCDRWDSNEESGCSLHTSLDHFEKWHQNYRDRFNGNMGDCYHIPRRPKTAKVTPDIFADIAAAPPGLRLSPEEESVLINNKKLVISD